ncbi:MULTISPECIES: glutathione S-transferase N-terminal domain-containing protein [unclassified Beijerinckia]|uniref:glutathione S-transferase N-terminal domain-containing protein n=1 Tax=unclassified Beijerinckia TaxID=2638183 RepID=UPI000898CB22|nr:MULTISPECIES: glutathione S-transferase N-terminal domain-containing protein [unclassified Beijerinckia]MDH7797623.1 GST-like protein [Beijerinckia sp. GAS462]SEC92687.1 GST-like protein [Beijerinckia sp. 28-YEA-48]
MIDLYALTSPNVQKVYIALEELELPYKEHFVDVWKGDQFTADFMKLNPNAKIPVIVDHDGPDGKPITVFESGAILLYLAEKTGKLLPADKRARTEVLQWLMIQLTGVGPNFGNFVHFSRFAPKDNEYSLSRYHTEMLRIIDLIEQRLSTSAYLGGREYSLADISTWPWMRIYMANKEAAEKTPHLARWFSTIEKRDGVQRALAKIGKVQSVRETAKPQDMDRLFGRGQFARA